MILDRIISFWTSLRLTVVCLTLGMILVFIGTLAQVDLGLYKAQNEFFRSFLIYWGPKGASWKIPVFPGGYLIGSVLLANLIAAHIKRFTLSKKKIGIFMIHIGLIMMLLGQLLTDMLAHESGMHLREGQSKNYSESDRRNELAVIDVSGKDTEKVVAIPESRLEGRPVISNAELPFSIRVEKYYPNSILQREAGAGFEKVEATGGVSDLWLKQEPIVTSTDERDIPSAKIEVLSPKGSLGTWLVSGYLNPQKLTFGDKTYEISLRSKRYYKPYSVELLEFHHAIYKGTDIPKDFASVVRLRRPGTGEDREVRIYMNNPLRYNGETYYQQSFDKDDHGSVLQVVRNPSWLTPYFSCALVGSGMVVQFLTHLFGFIKRRKKA